MTFGATYIIENGELVITGVFPVEPDWQGFRHHGYCRPTAQEIVEAGYEL
jgi:hypothetical protein